MASINRNNNQLEIWKERIREREKSGLSIKEWCIQNQINQRVYYYWQKKLRNPNRSDELSKQAVAGENEFVELTFNKDSDPKPTFEVLQQTDKKIPSNVVGVIQRAGIYIEVTREMPVPLLRQIMEVLANA